MKRFLPSKDLIHKGKKSGFVSLGSRRYSLFW